MKRVLKAGWLVMAAALMIGMAACSNDDDKVPEHPDVAPPPRVSTVHITVGAGIGDAATRSDVTDDGGNRRLVFTTGDKLFVYASVTADYNYFLAGTLSIVPSSIKDDGKTASFTGDLQVYNFEGITPKPSSYAFTDADPLNECENHTASLIAKDMVEGCYTIKNYWYYEHDFKKSIVVDDPYDDSDDCVSTLMKTALKVESISYNTEYYGDEGPKMFRGFEGKAIMNCTISGLTSGTAYTVTLLADDNESDYNSHSGSAFSLTYATPVTATGGTARFAIGFDQGNLNYTYISLKLEGGGQTRYVMLGRKKSIETNKVYRVNREATAQ